MSNCVPWRIEDTTGENPTGRAGQFVFRVWFERSNVADSAIEIVGVDCTSVRFHDEETSRKPAPAANELCSAWFETQLDTLPDVFSAVETTALELLYCAKS